MIDSSIAVIVPVYNVERYLDETLISIKNQISKPNEIIIIDDGSTDNSFEIIKKYSTDSIHQIIRTKNNGLGQTRNLGLSIAKSEYIYFCDADDLINEDLILRFRSILKKYNKPDIILFSGENISENKSIREPNLKFSINGNYKRGSGLISELVKRNEALPQAGRYITKSSLWSKNNIKYPSSTFGEDEAVFFPLLALSESTIVLSEIYLRYRNNREGSLTNTMQTERHVESYLGAINIILEFMSNNLQLIKSDISAWTYRLSRNCLKYISICLKTKTSINWKIIILLIFKVKNIFFPFKLLWRIIKSFNL